ncbi:unnamed protein product [Gadus morhua 'NCC']
MSQTTGQAVCRQRQRSAYLVFYKRQKSLLTGGTGPSGIGGLSRPTSHLRNPEHPENALSHSPHMREALMAVQTGNVDLWE